MAQNPTLKKPQPLTAAIIAYMKPGKERGDVQCAGLGVRCLPSGQKGWLDFHAATALLGYVACSFISGEPSGMVSRNCTRERSSALVRLTVSMSAFTSA